MIKIGIIGGTGYTGVELLRLLSAHPDASLQIITSRSQAGMPVAELFPSLRGHVDLAFSEPDTAALSTCDLVFSATPTGIAMTYARELLEAGCKLIDLAADFRIRDQSTWEQWYGVSHACPELLAEAIYGLPELNREAILGASLVANPGCYPTAVSLGLIPLLAAGAIDTTTIIADAKSGVSGAGRAAVVGSLFSEVSDSFKAYKVDGHRHHPEIAQTLADVSGESPGLVFVPHLVPMLRGIHATLYTTLADDDQDVQAIFESHYADEPFVDVLPAGSHPDTRSVRGSNFCRIAVHPHKEINMVVVLSVIDNLVKGAAGQAVQNMNLMFDFPEALGLENIALLP